MVKLNSSVILIVLVIIFAINSAWSWSIWGRRSGSRNQRKLHNYDIGSKRELTNLYNQKVVHAERVERPLSGSSFKLYPFSHTGYRLTAEDGSQWLAHKGKNYGKSGGDTVITSAKHMSSKWKAMPGSSHRVHKSTVGDFVKAGGKKYSTLNKNCHRASKKMGKLP